MGCCTASCSHGANRLCKRFDRREDRRRSGGQMNNDKATRSVLRVGGGRGFVVEAKLPQLPQELADKLKAEGLALRRAPPSRRVIITAAHCLPRRLPPACSFPFDEERTYKKLLGPLGGKATVWAEMLFADPVADIAVLGEPDGQKWHDESSEYEQLVDAAKPIRIADVTEEDGPALILSL